MRLHKAARLDARVRRRRRCVRVFRVVRGVRENFRGAFSSGNLGGISWFGNREARVARSASRNRRFEIVGGSRRAESYRGKRGEDRERRRISRGKE